MARLLASSQITIVDLNDAVSLQSYITSTHPRLQFLNNNGTYIPNFIQSPVSLNAELYKMGSKTNLVTSPGNEVSKVEWFVKIAPSQEYVKITPQMTEYELIGTSPFYTGVKLKQNVMNASKPGCTFKSEISFKEIWMEEIHVQKTEIDFTLSMQGNDGADAYTAVLTNPTHSVLCKYDGTPEVDEIGVGGRAYCDTLLYKGTELLTAVASNPGKGQYSITLTNTGCTSVKSDNDTFYIDTLASRSANIKEDGLLIEDKGTAEIDSNISAKNISNGGKIKVVFNIEGETELTQDMTFTKVFSGADGSDGTDGKDGESAKYLTLSIKEGSNVFKYEKNSTTPNITKTVLKANAFNIASPTYAWSYYANGAWSTISGQTSSELTVNATDNYFNISNSITFRCTTKDNLSDEITISKLTDGDDSITVQLSNESHVIACTNSGAFKPGESDRATTDITAYKGATALTLTNDANVGKGKYKITVQSNSNITYTLTNNVIKITDMSADSAVLLIDINCEGRVYKKGFSLSKARDGKEGIDGYIAILTNEFHSLPASSSGSVTSYTGASSSIELFKGDTKLTSGVTYNATANTGVTGTMSGNTYTVTGLTVDSSSVNLTATYNGKSYSKTFTITKNKQGQAGSDGQDGQHANSYWILPSTTQIHKNKDGQINPSSVTFKSMVQSGENPLQDYNGRFKIHTSTDGSSFTEAYTSSSNETSKSFSVPASAKAIKCELYLAGGTTTLLDVQTIFVSSDGQDGQDGVSATYVLISGEQAFKYGPNFIGNPVPSQIVLTRSLFGGLTGGKWQYMSGNSWLDFNPVQTGGTLTVTPTLGAFSDNSVKSMRVRFMVNDSKFDEMSIIKVADGAAGADAYTVLLTNESCTIPTNNDGSSPDFSKAISDVIAYKGGSKLSNSAFTIALKSNGATGCSVNVDNTNKKVTFTAISADSATATIEITIDNNKFEKVFSATRAKKALDGTPAKLITLASTSQTFVTNKEGAITPNAITITGTAQNLTGTTTYAWTKSTNGGDFGSISGTTATRQVVPDNVKVGQSCTYKLTATNDGKKYEDSVTIVHLREGNDGTDAYTVVLSNPSHTVPASSSGVASGLDYAYTDVIVYKGASIVVPTSVTEASKVPNDAVFSIAAATSSVPARIKLNTFPNNADTATCTVNIVVGGQTIKQVFTVTKAKKGTDGTNAKAVYITGKQFFKYLQGSSTPTDYSSIQLTGFEQNLSGTLNRKWYADGAVIANETGTNLVVAHNASYWGNKTAITIKYESGGVYDEISIAKLYDGNDAYTVILDNESHSIACNSSGTPNSDELGTNGKAKTKVKVYKGSTPLTASNTAGAGKFKITASANIADSAGTCAYIVENSANVGIAITAANKDSGQVPITIDVDGGRATLTKIFSFSKSKTGQTGAGGAAAKAIQITGAVTVVFKADGTKEPASNVRLDIVKKNTTGTIVWKNGTTVLKEGDFYDVPVTVLQNASTYEIRAEVKGDTGVYDTHTIRKVIDGQNSVTGYIWCPDGHKIKNDSMKSIKIDGVVFNGSSNVSEDNETKYHWEKRVGEKWVDIKGTTSAPIAGGSAGGHTVTISQDDIPSMLVVRCNISYKSTKITDSIVLEDIMDPVQASIYSTAGTTFKNGQGDTFLVARAYRNGIEEDPIRLVDSVTGVTGSQGEIIFNKSDKKYYKYNNNAWGVINTPTAGSDSVFDYIWSKSNSIGEIDSGYNRVGKVIYVQSNEVSQKASFMVDVEG